MSAVENIFTVSELTAEIRYLIENNFSYINLTGEISNFKIHGQSGHFYFTLKDETAQIQAVMWKTRNQMLNFIPEDGMNIIVKGRITLYPARGTYQIEVWELTIQGAGVLQERFEMLKKKLYEEGIFSDEYKKSLPPFPENIAIITSHSGAVIQDFITVLGRRYPVADLFLYPVSVQGSSAAKDVTDALKDIHELVRLKEIPKIDIIVIARGGGSFEDLFPFNDETLARCIFDCKIPVVSAIGHETDFTICDFVSDLRAPTPSAAAEMITPDINELIDKIGNISYFYRSFVQNKISLLKNSVKEIENHYYFNKPKDVINDFYLKIDSMSSEIENLTNSKISFLKNQLKSFERTFVHIKPSNTLKKGYAIISKNGELCISDESIKISGEVISRAKKIKKSDNVTINMYDGKLKATIN